MVSDLTQRAVAQAPAKNLAQSPLDKVQQYVNTQPSMGVQPLGMGGSTTLLPGERNVERRDSVVNFGKTPMQRSAYKQLDTIKQSSDRIRGIYEQKARSSLGGGGGSMAGVGKAWNPDGSLSQSRNSLLSNASQYLGSRYVLGGTTRKGIDCSGLVMMVYNKMGFNISRHSATWQGRNIPGVRTSISNLRPGDIVAWKDGSHIAIYAGNGEIIEAANERVGTVRRKIWANPGAIYGIAVRLPGE